jgi:hypothetical protein
MKFLLTAILFTCMTAAVSAAQNPRIFVTDSNSWEVSGGGGGTSDGFGQSGSGGARPQTAEIMKTFAQRCPNVTINNRKEKADYVVLLDHEGGKVSFTRDNKIVIFNHDGDSIATGSTRSLGNAVKDACTAITQDWNTHGRRQANERQESKTETAATTNK